MGGGSDVDQTAHRLGLPADLVAEAENFKHADGSVYPDNEPIVSVFVSMLTQWRTGSGGVIGLDYNVLPIVFRFRGISDEEQPDVFDGIQVMERAALGAINEQRKDR